MSGYSWVPAQVGEIPKGALVCGRHFDGEAVYAARAEYIGHILPGRAKLHEGAYIGCGGYEISMKHYEVLVCDESAVSWVFERDGRVPERAMVVGRCDDKNENLYLGRAFHDGSITVGKVHPSCKCMFLPYLGSEIEVFEYEVLVCNNNRISQLPIDPVSFNPTFVF